MIHRLLCDFEAPWYQDERFTEQFERALLLALRQIHRADLGLQPAVEAGESWQFRPLKLRRFHPAKARMAAPDKTGFMTAEPLKPSEYAPVITELITTYPNVYHFLGSIDFCEARDLKDEVFEQSPFQNGPYGAKSGITATWAIAVIEDCIMRVINHSIVLDVRSSSWQILRSIQKGL